MPILINFKICDNAKECNGISVCPTKALFWDEKTKKIKIDNKKCVNCGLCVKACMVDAIHLAKTAAEYESMQKEIDEDTREISDLLVDRYGAMPIHPAFLISEDKFNLEIIESNKLVVLEVFNNESIQCLIRSIPIKELFKYKEIKYRKIEKSKILDKYNLKEMPAILFFKNRKLIGKVEGYYNQKEKEKLIKKINKIQKK